MKWTFLAQFRRIKKKFNKTRSILGSSNDRTITLQEVLKELGIEKSDSLVISENTTTQDYLDKHSVQPSGIKIQEEERRSKIRHRDIILLCVSIPMTVFPFWAMAIITLSAMHKKDGLELNQGTEIALVTATVGDLFGLYKIIVGGVFSTSRSDYSSNDDDDEQGKEAK